MITVLSGANSYAIHEALTHIKQAFIDQHGVNGIEVVPGNQLEPDNLSPFVAGATLFASHRLVIIKNLSENKVAAERLLDLYKNVPEETHLVLVEDAMDKRTAFYKTLKKETEFHEFTPLNEAAAAAWVGELVRKEEGSITHADAQLLVRYAGVDQSRLANEVAKLLAHGSTISKDAIEQLVEKNPEETIFQLLDCALSGRTNDALTVLEGLERAHEDPFQAVNMLIWQTHILAVVSSAKAVGESELARDIKINPFVIKKTKVLASKISQPEINRIIDAVAAVDIQLKTTSVNPWRLLEATIFTLRS